MGSLSRLVVVALSLLALGGCTTTSLLLSATGMATDTSMTWEIVKHVHAQLTEGDPTPCASLDSVERALNTRCGAFVEGSVRAADIKSSKFGACALTIAAREPRLWPVLPELVAKGARPEACTQSPMVAFAQANECPDLNAVSADVRATLSGLARSDPRAVHHDVVRWLSCPNSRAVGMDRVLTTWLDDGALAPGTLSFSPLAALHPSAITLPLAAALEAHGHTADAAFDGFVGQRAPGFEEALRTCDWAALEWWLVRRPQLANRVPGQQLDWLPLARVLAPGFLAYADSRADMVGFLIAHGADPRTRLPSDSSQSILTMARAMRSPLVGVLEAAAPGAEPGNTVATNSRALRLIGQ
ncbi:MAG: hypothetical protein ABI702_12305 [Burkholderiales bacterium]